MKRLKFKRWKSDFSKKRKLLIALILITMTSLGVGYAYLVTELNINGSIVVKEYNAPTLYNVLRNEALSGGLAKEYTGNHNDSIDPSLSTEKIYHYYANGNSDESKILGMNNVLFAGFCWRMYRTTDTGGVKMIYNGKAVDNKCESKGKADYISSVEKVNLNDTYWYGTEIEYDATQNKYYLSGDVAQYGPWSDETADDIVGKYTCKTTENEGCNTYVYYVATYFDNTYALVYNMYASNYNNIGYVPFTYDRASIGDGGYMYGEPIQIKSLGDSEGNDKLSTTTKTMLDYDYFNGNYWVADSFSYNSSTNKYTLVNPYQMSTVSDYTDLVGKYTLNNTSSTASNTYAYYIIDISIDESSNPNKSISALLSNGMDGVNNKPVIGDSITDNGDGTYTINNANPIDYNDWYENYHNYLNAYMCDNADACTNPKVIIYDGRYRYTICDATEEIMLGKDYEDGQLKNTIILKVYDYLINFDDYSDYRYTCSNKTDTCSSTEVRVITYLDSTKEGYRYDGLFFLGDGVTWDGEEYTLTNIKPNSPPDTNRFTCPEKGAKKCTTAAYIIDRYGSKSYLELNDGDTTLDEVLNRALANNIHDSETKIAIDEWYRKNMLDYSDYLEDTVFCNNRSISSYGSWIPPTYSEELRFFSYYNSDDLSCSNITDRFAVGNEQAKLKYKVAIPSYQEMDILGYSGGEYFGTFRVMSPVFPLGGRIYMRLNSRGSYNSNWYSYSVYPTISLKKDVQYTVGDGSLSKPYYIGESHTITVDSNLFNYPKNSIEGWKVYIKSDDYFVTSFKLNGEMIEGESFTMPDEDVTITDITYIPANYTIINTDNTVTVPSTGRYNTTITLDAGNSYGVSSFKLNGTVVEGNSFTMPAENVTITDVVKFEQITVESEHNPYPNSLNNVIYYENTFEDAMALKVELTYQTQYYDDCIYIYDSPNGSAIGGGRYSSYKKTDIININGNYVKIIFRTNDEDNDYYGFMAKITPIYPHNITNTNSLFNVENRALTGTTLNITSDDYIVTSFKLNGELIEGESFTMPNEDVTITDITYIPANYTITNTDNTVTVPSTGRYNTTITLVASSDYTVTSFKMNGELITGNSFTMPAENVTITDITKELYIMVESEHDPYLNNENNVVYFERTFEGATSISVELTYQTESVSWDWIYLYGSSNGTPINNKKYGGTTKTTEIITVNSNYLKIVFKTDSSVNNYYGFKAIITPNYS